MKFATPAAHASDPEASTFDRKFVFLLFALLFTQIGSVCDGTPAADPGAAPAGFVCTPSNVYVGPGGVFNVAVKFNTAGSVQAMNLDVKWDPVRLTFLSISPHPDFDDDGHFFSPVIVDAAAGRVHGVRDSRHGANALTGKKGIVSMQFRAETSQPSSIVTTGQLSNPQGVLSAGLTATCYVSPGQS